MSDASKQILRVVTFNTWHSGSQVEDGVRKTANHIHEFNADIVVLNEIYRESLDRIVELLLLKDPTWKAKSPKSGPSLAILTRHEFVKESEHTLPFAFAAQVELTRAGKQGTLSVWAIHLNWIDYGPYDAHCPANVPREAIKEKIFKNDAKHGGRSNQIDVLKKDEKFQEHDANVENVPLVVLGDFNEPSHLDWTETTKAQHNGWVDFPWPVSTWFAESGFVDSFRAVHPDPLVEPGITWSTVDKYHEQNMRAPEPQDRIDLIYSKGTKLVPVGSFVCPDRQQLDGLKAIPNHAGNGWPSDHFAVVSNFEWVAQSVW